MSFSEQEIEEFKSEAMELLDVAEKSLLAIDHETDFHTAFDAVFRCFHNLKGSAGMMELVKLQAHTHELETILMPFKEQTAMPKPYVQLFLRGIDAARSLLDGQDIQFDFQIENTSETKTAPVGQEAAAVAEPTPPPLGIEEFIAECDEIIERISQQLRAIESGAYNKETLDNVYRDMHSLKGASYLFGFTQMGDLAHAMESSLEPLRNGTHKPSPALLDGLYKAIECVETEIICTKKNIKNEKMSETAPAIARALVAAMNKLEPLTSQTVTPLHPVSENGSESNASIRVPVALLDSLMTLMGEMVLVRNQVLQFSNESEDLNFLNLSQRLNAVTSEIQAELMKTRMQPIGNILNKFHRVTRDLSHELKKEISLNIIGAETELDKSLLESMKDPLTHIVRNSCDHGIEPPDVRRKAGKTSTCGTITMKAYHEGGQVVIEVSDDGKGLNKELLLKKGVEKGLITEAQAHRLSDKEVFNLIFAPGFSTAQQITNVSGRGVGMDVVRTNIEKIGGTVDLESQIGSGTTIRLKVPLTLAIVPALIIHCGQNTYAIPQIKLVELVRVDQNSENKIEYLQSAPVYRLRGHILPLIDLNQILSIKSINKSFDSEDRTVVNIAVLNAEHQSFGLIVDDIQDTADIVVKPLSRLLKSLQVYSGATILGDGSVALILDVQGLAKMARLHSENRQSDTAKSGIDESAMAHRMADQQDFILVQLHSPTKHAIVLGYVHRLEEFKRSQIEVSGHQRVVRYRQSILPIISANEHLQYGLAPTQKDTVSVVVVERGGQSFGIEVDDILDTLSTTAEVNTALIKNSCIIGNLNTDQELIVVIDPFELIHAAYPDFHITTPKPKDVVELEGPAKVLLVEDTVFFRKLVKGVLEKAGYQVTVAGDGIEALEVLKNTEGHFDIVVSDIEMPRMNGFQLATAIRSQKKYSALPLLALSSRYDRNYLQEGAKAGFNLYLEKMNSEAFLKAIHDLLFENRRTA